MPLWHGWSVSQISCWFQSPTANTATIDARNDFFKGIRGLDTWNLFQALKKQIQVIILHHALCYFWALQVRNTPLKFIGYCRYPKISMLAAGDTISRPSTHELGFNPNAFLPNFGGDFSRPSFLVSILNLQGVFLFQASLTSNRSDWKLMKVEINPSSVCVLGWWKLALFFVLQT